MPFQIELLSGFITLDLVARDNKLQLTDAQRAEAHVALIESFFVGLADRKSVSEHFADDAAIQKAIDKGVGKTYDEELRKCCDGLQFRRVILKKSQPTDVLDAVPEAQWEDFAQGVSEAIGHDPRLGALTALRTPAEVLPAIVAVARRTRIDSAGSQGLLKYLVRLHRPFTRVDSDVILYLKQEVISAPERVNLADRDARLPGARCVQDADAMLDPPMLIDSWCDVKGHSFWVSLKEPWSEDFSAQAITTPADLIRAAKMFGYIAGASHRHEASHLPKSWSPYLVEKLESRADAYLQQQAGAFAAFKEDLRTQADIAACAVRLSANVKKR